MLLTYSLLGGSALFICLQDIRWQTIPLSGLLVFMGASFLNQFWMPEFEGLWTAGTMALILMSCQGLFYLFRQKLAMGWGDLILAPSCGLWLHIQEFPTFCIATGLFGLLLGSFWRYRWGMTTFPFAPAILLGLGVIFLIRCFLMMNEI